jgi:hypothetical protein
VERIVERRNIVIYLDQLKTETDPIKREVLKRLLIQEIDKADIGDRLLTITSSASIAAGTLKPGPTLF